MTHDEIMRLRAPKKNKDGTKILKPGDMLTFVAGHPPIRGRQALYFFDKTLKARSKLPPVDSTEPNTEANNSDDTPAPEIGASAPSAPSPITARLRAAGQSSAA